MEGKEHHTCFGGAEVGTEQRGKMQPAGETVGEVPGMQAEGRGPPNPTNQNSEKGEKKKRYIPRTQLSLL